MDNIRGHFCFLVFVFVLALPSPPNIVAVDDDHPGDLLKPCFKTVVQSAGGDVSSTWLMQNNKQTNTQPPVINLRGYLDVKRARLCECLDSVGLNIMYLSPAYVHIWWERQMVIQGPAGRINHSDTFKCARAVIKIKTTVVPGLSPEVTGVMNLWDLTGRFISSHSPLDADGGMDELAGYSAWLTLPLLSCFIFLVFCRNPLRSSHHSWNWFCHYK